MERGLGGEEGPPGNATKQNALYSNGVLLVALTGLVTITIEACPLPQGLEKLSAVVGAKLTSAPIFRNETLIARLDGADPDRVLSEIAYALDAKWEDAPAGKILKPDPLIPIRRANAKNAEVAATVRRILTGLNADLAKQPGTLSKAKGDAMAKELRELTKKFQEAEKKGDQFEGQPSFGQEAMPGWRAGARLALGFGAQQLLALQVRERVVWAERPTPMQRPFPLSMASAIANYRREAAPFVPAPIVRVLLSIDRSAPDSFTVRLKGLGPAGQEVDTATVELSEGDDTEEAVEPATKPVPGEKPIDLPPDTVEFLSTISYRAVAVRGENFEKFRKEIRSPDQFDPLALTHGAILNEVSKATGQNLIGVLDDGFADHFFRAPFRLTPTEWLRQLGVTVEKRNGWLVARPMIPGNGYNRQEVKGFLAAAESAGGLSIDSASEWHRKHFTGGETTWLQPYLGILTTGRGLSSSIETLDPEALALWMCLSFGERNALREGSSISIARLSPAARKWIFEKVYWDLEILRSQLEKLTDEASVDELDAGEVTDTLPSGIDGGTISLWTETSPVITAWSSLAGEPVVRSTFSAEAYGMALFRSERRGSDPGYDRFRLGTNRRYRIMLQIGKDKLSFDGTMSETFFDNKAPARTQIPADFYSQALASKQKLREQTQPPPVTKP